MTRPRGLRQRDFVVLALLSGVSVIGDTAAVIALTLRLHADGSTGWLIAALLFAGSAPMVVLSPLAGALVDRIDSRTAIGASALVQAACAFALSEVTATTPTLLLVAAMTAAGTLVGPATAALVPRIVPADRLVDANAVTQGVFILGNLAGPVVGGVLTGAFGSRAPLQLDALTFVVVAGGILLVRTRRRPVVDAATRPNARSGLRAVTADPVLRAVVASMTLLVLASGAVNVAEVFLVKDALHGSDAMYGAIAACWMAGMVAGSAVTPRLGRDIPRLLVALAVAEGVMAAGLVVAGAAPVWSVAAAAFVIGGVGNGVVSVACRTIVVIRVADAFRGRVSGVMTGSINAASVIAFGAGGGLVSLVGSRATVVGCGVAGLAVAVTFAAVTRREKHWETEAAVDSVAA